MKRRKKGAYGRNLLILCVLLTASVAVGWWIWGDHSSNQQSTSHAPSVRQESPVPKPVSAQAKVLFGGTTFWGRMTEEWSMKSPLKYKFPFQRLKEFDREKYTAWIAGLECPMKASVHMTAAEQEENLQFNCSPDFLPEAKKWFTAFTLANNHSDNQGADGFAETKKHLDENGIQYFGHYDPKKTEDTCDVIALPVKVKKDDGQSVEGKLPVAMCGYHGVFGIPPEESVAVMKRYSKVMPVFALPHMGAEYKPAPDQIKTDFYRSLIDGGADAVIADHPHWVQTTEAYKGHLIVYSMGNFMFDQQFNLEVTRSAAIRMEMEVKDESDLEAWLKIGETCGTYHDDCLEKIEDRKLKKLSATYKFGVVGTRDDNKQTHLANPSDNAAILQRLNWNQTMSRLDSPYGSL